MRMHDLLFYLQAEVLLLALALVILVFWAGIWGLHILGILYSKWKFYRKKVDNGGRETPYPGVSILKPLVGVDSNLFSNLESFFTLKYPLYEILFCVHAVDDPSLLLVQTLIKKYPNVDATVLIGGEHVGVNPKINNLMPGYRNAKYDLFVISDAGMRMKEDSLLEMVETMTENVGVVTQMPFTCDRKGFAGTLEKVYFGTGHCRLYMTADLAGIVCSTGMSSLIRKTELDEVGGLQAFAIYLAEDYFIAQALVARGWKCAVASTPGWQNSGVCEVNNFHERMCRWAKLRIAMLPHTIILEPLQDCMLLGGLASWASNLLFDCNSLVFFLVHVLIWMLLDYVILHTVQEQLTVRVYGVRQEDTVSVQRGVVVVDRSLVLIKPKPELKKQDRIVAVNQTKCSTAQEAMELLLKQGQGPFELTVDRGPVDHKTRLVVEVMRKQGQAWGLGCTEDKDKREVRVSSLSGVATEANLEEDDHILSINDKRITSLQDLREVAAKADKLTIHIVRSPADSESESEGEEEEASESEDEDLDLMTITITKRPGQPVGLGCKEDKKDQVHISSLSGLAKETNLKVGDKIVTLNGKKVESLEALRNLVGISQQLTIQVGRSKEEEKKEEKPKPTPPPPPPVRLPDRTPSMEKITTPGAGQADTEEVNLELQCDEGEPIGVYPDENLKIVRIQTGSIGAQKFKMGDIIKKVNKWPITDVNHFFTAIERSPRPLHVTVNRSVSREKEAKLKQLPAHLEKLVRRHSGFDYLMLDVSFDEKAGKHFGLALANCAHNKVLVTGMKDGSVSADHFKIFDRIVAINGTPVTDENVAKSYICASAGNFQAVVERPVVGETQLILKHEYEQWKAMRSAKQRENEMPTDVQEIVAKESERRKGELKPTRSALKKSVTPIKGTKGLTWQGSHTEIQIQSDVPEGKKLRKVS